MRLGSNGGRAMAPLLVMWSVHMCRDILQGQVNRKPCACSAYCEQMSKALNKSYKNSSV